jgi:hypothetical protein
MLGAEGNTPATRITDSIKKAAPKHGCLLWAVQLRITGNTVGEKSKTTRQRPELKLTQKSTD